MQRVIANKAKVESSPIPLATAALEKMGNGEFEINWHAAAVTIRSDHPAQNSLFPAGFEIRKTCSFRDGDMELTIPVISCDGAMIRDAPGWSEPIRLPLNATPLTFDVGREDVDFESDKPQGPESETESIHAPSSETADAICQNFEVPSEITSSEMESAEESSKEGVENEDAETVVPLEPKKAPKRIFLGATDQGRDIFREFGHPELTNRHLLIFGKSGAGKTYAIQTLLFEFALAGQNAVIVDYTEGFLPLHLETVFKETANPATFLAKQQPLPINPFRKQAKIIEGFDPIPDTSHAVGGRVASVIDSVYSAIGEKQSAVLMETIAEGLDREGESFGFSSLLEDLKEKDSSAAAPANKISPLVRENLFSGSSAGNWQTLYENRVQRVSVLQLAGVNRLVSRIATEFILWDLYDYASNSGSKDRPLPVVLDEIQNLDHRLDSPLGKALTEGRKFGLSLVLATQTLSNLKAEERDRLFQASHKLFFKPAETEVKEYAKILEQSSSEKAEVWISRLNRLNKGECYSLGPFLNPATEKLENRALKIKITSFEERAEKRRVKRRKATVVGRASKERETRRPER